MDAPLHPFNRLARERLLRWQLVSEPSLIGAVTLVAPPVPRLNVKDAVPCVAAGRDAPGAAIVVVCSTGVDLDLIPFAADPAGGGVGSACRATARSSSPGARPVKVTEQRRLLRRPCELATHG